jgi:predicted RNA-binding protein
MNYWLDLFTGRTWREFQKAGSHTTGFREHNWNRAKGIKPGDIFLCYLLGVKRWVGLLEVTSERYRDEARIFEEELFPVRLKVKPITLLAPEHGVPMESLAGKLTFFPVNGTARQWSGLVRGSPARYKPEDGDVIATAIREAVANPVIRPVDAKKLDRPTNLYKLRARRAAKRLRRS